MPMFLEIQNLQEGHLNLEPVYLWYSDLCPDAPVSLINKFEKTGWNWHSHYIDQENEIYRKRFFNEYVSVPHRTEINRRPAEK